MAHRVSASRRIEQKEVVQGYIRDMAEDALERGGPSDACLELARKPAPPSTDRWGTVTNQERGQGGEGVRFSVDTTELTVWGMSVGEVCEHVACWFLGATPFDEDFVGYFEDKGHGARRYRRLLVAPGVKVYADSVTGADHTHIEIEGQGMRGIGAADFRLFLCGLRRKARRLTSTRIDPAWDNCPFSPMMVYEAAIRGDIRCTTRRRKNWARIMLSDEGVVTEWEDEDFDEICGDTCYIGFRGADRMLRCYDGRGYTRLEHELRGDRATALLNALMDSAPEEWSRLALGHLLDHVSFCDRKADRNVTRAASVLLDWWRGFVGDATRAGCRIRRPVRVCVDAAKRDAEKIWRKVVKLQGVFGASFVEQGVKMANEALRDSDRAWVRVRRAALAAAQAVVGPVVARSHHPSYLFDLSGGLRVT